MHPFHESLVREHRELVSRYNRFQAEFLKANGQCLALLDDLTGWGKEADSRPYRKLATGLKRLLEHTGTKWL